VQANEVLGVVLRLHLDEAPVVPAVALVQQLLPLFLPTSANLPRSRTAVNSVAPGRQTAAADEQQKCSLAVLLLDERGSDLGADRVPADSSISSASGHLRRGRRGSS
jgi:hypothetical protein